jgi:hypothetical protein
MSRRSMAVEPSGAHTPKRRFKFTCSHHWTHTKNEDVDEILRAVAQRWEKPPHRPTATTLACDMTYVIFNLQPHALREQLIRLRFIPSHGYDLNWKLSQLVSVNTVKCARSVRISTKMGRLLRLMRCQRCGLIMREYLPML